MAFSEDWSSKKEIRLKAKSFRGFFPTSKSTHAYVEFESGIERDFCFLADHDSDVEIFIHQPHKIKVSSKIYTPDYKFKSKSLRKNIIVEIKSAEDLKDNFEKTYKRKFKLGLQFARENEMLFVVLTDDILRQNLRLHNIMFAKGSSRVGDNDYLFDPLNSILLDFQGITFNKLCNKLAKELGLSLPKASQILCYHIYYGNVFTKNFSTEALDGETQLFSVNKDRKPFKTLVSELDIVEEAQIWENILEGDIEILSGIRVEDNPKNNSDLYEVPPKYMKLVEGKLSVIENWQKEKNKIKIRKQKGERVSKDSINRFLEKETVRWLNLFDGSDITRIKALNERTIRRWVKAHKEKPVIGLIPNYKNSGKNKRPKSQKKKIKTETGTKIVSLYSEKAIEYYHEYRQYYLAHKLTTTITAVYRKYLQAAEDEINNGNLEDEDILRLDAFKTYIYRYSNKSELSIGLYDKSTYKTKYSTNYGEVPRSLMPMMVVENDHSQSDEFIKDEEYNSSLTPPWLTGAICTYTGMLTGYYLSMDNPSSTTIIESLIQSIMPKNQFLKDFKLENEKWEIQGKPLILRIDNGRDYAGTNLVHYAVENGIILEYARLGTGSDKPFIEKFFHLVWNAMKEEDHRGFRPSFFKRIQNRDYKPDEDPDFSFFEFEKWFVEWLLKIHHKKSKMKKMKASPNIKLDEVLKGKGRIILPQTTDAPNLKTSRGKLTYAKMKKWVHIIQQYSLKSGGIIERLDLTYRSVKSIKLFKKYSTNGKSVNVNVLIERRDVSTIRIESPDSKEPYIEAHVYGNIWHEIQNVLPKELVGLPISLNQWKRMRKILKTENDTLDPQKLKEYYKKRTTELANIRQGSKSAIKKSKRIRTDITASTVNAGKLGTTSSPDQVNQSIESNNEELIEYDEEEELLSDDVTKLTPLDISTKKKNKENDEEEEEELLDDDVITISTSKRK